MNQNENLKIALSESESQFLKKVLAQYRKGCKSLTSNALIKGEIKELHLQVKCDSCMINLSKNQEKGKWE